MSETQNSQHGVGGVYEEGADGKLKQVQAPTLPGDHPDHPNNKKSTEPPAEEPTGDQE
jgi:hypothetical protein